MIPAPNTRKEHETPAKVFIIDDDSAVRVAMTRLLRAAGCDAAAFPDVDAFLKHADVPDHCCVVADIRMPGTSSLDLPKLLNERGLKVPVIFVTAYDTDQSRTEAKRAGAAAYFRKPVDDHALLDAIKWALDNADQSARSDSSVTKK